MICRTQSQENRRKAAESRRAFDRDYRLAAVNPMAEDEMDAKKCRNFSPPTAAPFTDAMDAFMKAWG